jgi:hypothetical protein
MDAKSLELAPFRNPKLAAAAERVAKAIPTAFAAIAHSEMVEIGPNGEDVPLIRIVVPDAPVPKGWHVLYPPPALPVGASARIRIDALVPDDLPPSFRRHDIPSDAIVADGFRFALRIAAEIPLDEEAREIDIGVLVARNDGTISRIVVLDAEKEPPKDAEVSNEPLHEQGFVDEERLLDPWGLGEIDLDDEKDDDAR